MTGATGYHYRYRAAKAASWTEATETAITETSFTIGSLTAGTNYEVQVRALRDLETGPWSPSSWVRTPETNHKPEFGKSSYSAGLVKNKAGNGEGLEAPIPLITVSAADANTGLLLNTLTYSITGGNTGNKFAIDSATGAVTYTGGGETSSGRTFNLTVGVTDGKNAGGADDDAVDDTATLRARVVAFCSVDPNAGGTQTGEALESGKTYTETTTINLAASCIGIQKVEMKEPGKSLTVNGNGYTIRGVGGRTTSRDFMFRSDYATSTTNLNNLTIEGAYRGIRSRRGVANANNVSFIDSIEAVSAYYDGEVTLNNVHFQNNAANGSDRGNSIHTFGGEVEVTDSRFVGNSKGDAVLFAGDITVTLKGCLSQWSNTTFTLTSPVSNREGTITDASAGECLGRTGNPGVGNNPNAKPAFDRASYAFGLLKDGDGSGDGDAIPAGGVGASDPDAPSIYNTLAYSITAGNTGNKFAIDAATGAIAYKGSGEGTAGTTITLTVGVTDGKNAGGTDNDGVDATASVKVKVVESCGLRGGHEYAEDTTVNLAASCLGIKDIVVAAGKTLTVNGNGYAIRGMDSGVLFKADADGKGIELNNLTIEKADSPINVSGGSATANNVSFVNSNYAVIVTGGSAALDDVYFEGNSYNNPLIKFNSISVLNSAASATVNDAKFIKNTEGDYVIGRTAGTLTLTGCLSESGSPAETDDTGFKVGTITDNTTGECEGRTGNRGLGQELNGAPKLAGKVIYLFLEENADGSSEAVAIDTPPAADPDAGSGYGSATYTLGGPDAGKFSIDSGTGAISYIGEAQNYEDDPTPLLLQVAVTDGKDARGRADFENDATATVIVSIADEDDEIPDAPAKPALTPGDNTYDLTASWTKPPLTKTGGPAVTGYTVEFATGTGSDAKTFSADITDPDTTSYTFNLKTPDPDFPLESQ